MQASQRAIDIIKQFEKFRSHVYDDGVGNPTIGYGHLVLEGEDFPDGITQEEAEEILFGDVGGTEEDLSNLVDVALNQEQYDALISFVFNVGGSKFAVSKTLQILNRGEYLKVPAALRTWCKAKDKKTGTYKKLAGLVKRRHLESGLFEEGNRKMFNA